MHPTISIIIPTKNEGENLPRLLASILTQTAPPKEVIIVDNYSTDGTQAIAKQIWSGPDLPQLTIVAKGAERSEQRNAGARLASGSHLIFLDADMEVPPTLIPKLYLLAKKGVKAANLRERALGHDFWGKAIALERNCYRGEPILEAPRFIETKLFHHLGGYDPALIAGEDWDLAERIKKNGAPIVRTKSSLTHHEAKGFLPNLRRKWYYTQHIRHYARKHPGRFLEQSALRIRLKNYWENRQMLIRYPVHTLAFLLMKALIYGRFRLRKR